MPERLTPIERLRRHREEMQLALRDGLTLDQARSRLASYREHRPRLEAEPGFEFPIPTSEPAERPMAWWQRD